MREINYTICPVANASYIAAHKGFLEEELKKVDTKPVRLQTLSAEHWKEHFTYENDRLFREGGNTPPLWSKSQGRKPLLIGLNIIVGEQAIIVRADSEINSIKDLKGKKIGIADRFNEIIDHQKTAQTEGFEIALQVNGLKKEDVEWVEVKSDRPNFFNGTPEWKFTLGVEYEALKNGTIDAAFVKLSAAERLLDTGDYKKIFNIVTDQKDFVPVNNEVPNVLTVSEKLAKEEPEVVVAFLKAAIKAARWAKDNKDEAEALLAEQTHGTVDQYRRAYGEEFYKHLEPNFSEEGLAALDIRAQFLYEHGFADRKVDVYEWADRSFLQRALEELENE